MSSSGGPEVSEPRWDEEGGKPCLSHLDFSCNFLSANLTPNSWQAWLPPQGSQIWASVNHCAPRTRGAGQTAQGGLN